MYRLIECLDFLALPRLGSGRILKVGIDAERGMNQRAEGEDRYRSLFQNSHAVMLLIDSESGEIADANPAACRFYGWTLEELRGLTIDRINTLSPQQIQAEMQRAREQKREHFYFNHRLANGEIRNVEVYSNPVRIAGRTLLYSIVHDITERRRAEEERDRFFDLSGDLFCIGGFDGYLRQINPAWTRLLGWSEEDLLGRPWLDFVHPEDREKTAQNDRNMKNGLAAQNFENRFLRKDGSWRWLSWNVCLLPERGLVFAVARDVTGKKQAEQQIERLALAVEQAADAILITDARGVIQYVNPAFTRMTGFEAREILGQTPSVLDSGEREAGNYEHLWKTILAGQVWQGRITTRRRDGSLFECESTISPLCAEPGRVVSCVQVARDVTTEHRLEAQLRQAQKMESIGTLAGGIAHDFNNILTGIMGYADLALSVEIGESLVQDSLQAILKSAQRARSLVQQILAFSRQTDQERRPMRLQPILREVGKFLRGILPSTIQLRLELDEGCGSVTADPTQIHQVMMNLSTNAYHAMRERGGTLTIELRAMEVDAGFASGRIDLHPGPYAVLCVSDTGYGMDAEVLKRIFDPYFTTKGVGEGTGLGLAVVHGIVKSHRGAIDVRSEPGGGSRFQIYLPICAEIAAIEESGEREFAVPGGSERILLVDDEELIVELEKTFLERLGYRVSAFTQSPNALEAFQTQPDAFDLAITDFTMPGLTGTELAKAMLARRPGFPIILCTGFSESMDENRAKALGIRRFVLKPVLNRELARAVRAVLDGE